MLSPDDLRLVRSDPSVSALGLVLDPEALLDRLLPLLVGRGPRPLGARLDYLRYKPGVSLLGSYLLDTAEGPVRAYAKAWSAGSAPKLERVAGHAADDRQGFGAVVDADLLLVLVADTSDHDLPGVRALRASPRVALPRSHRGFPVRPLRYKPQRRWVGLAGDVDSAVMVKVHRPGTVGPKLSAHAALAAAGLPVPPVLRSRDSLGVVTTAYLPGRSLPFGCEDPALLRQVGAVLAGVHSVPPYDGQPAADSATALAEAVAGVAALDARTGEAARALAARLAAGHERGGASRGGAAGTASVTVHGDLSADQVVVGSGDHAPVSLVDLDALRRDEASADFGSWVAAELVHRAGDGTRPDLGAMLGAMLEGYRAAGGAAGADLAARLGPATAAAILARATEPFRLRQASWFPRMQALVDSAGVLAAVAA